ncbi:MAG: RNA 2',3'-cyclic phosphodiesterase [Nanoarchaeota archaeon]
MRVFISIDLPENVLDELCKIQNEIKKTGLIKGKLTERENIHLTLKFLGDVDEDNMKNIKDKLNKMKFKKFELRLDKLGVFNERVIRIIWVSVSGKEIFELQKDIDLHLSDLFEKEDRFMGHITIARPKFVKNKDDFLKILGKIELNKLNFPVDKIFLKKSELSKNGPRYETLLEINAKSKSL